MIAAMQTLEWQSPAMEQTPEVDAWLHSAAVGVLRASGYLALGALECEIVGEVIVVSGVVPSHYLRQVAQSALQRLAGARMVRNLVEVRPADGRLLQ